MKIFFSYPHDDNAQLIERIKQDLEARGHEVWFDKEEIKTGDEWRDKITRGILDSQQVVAFLSKHSVRDPGVCLNEIAIALADKGEAIVTVLVEPENEVKTPVSITHIQWLRMEDWAQQQANEEWYRNQLDKLVEAIEHPGHAGRNEELETLRLALDPMSFYAEIAPHIPEFTGRDWIINRYQQWLTEEPNSRVLRIEGGPGLGKTAVSSYLAHSTKSSVLAVHLCQYNKGESRNPLRFIRTLAYQLATRLPDYRGRLLKSVAIQRPESMQGKDPASLWSDLISAQLAGSGDKAVIDRQRLAIIIDGLDEATVDGKNSIVELLATEINTLPKWIGVVLTGRPDPELTQRLARFQPLVLRDDDPANLADLKDYCDQWFDCEIKTGKLNSAQAAAASQTLLTQSQGAFLYLRQARIAAQEGMLDLMQPATFPSGLTEIYQRFFERRFPEAWSDTGLYKTKIRPFLELVLASPEPLPLSLAADILQWREYEAPEVMRSLGSLIKRSKGGLVGEDEETVAPFHNSLREWLSEPDAAGDFFVGITESRSALTSAVWQRYLSHNEQDAYAWTVLPVLLPTLSHQLLDQLFGELTWETSQVLDRLADSLAPKLRFSEAAATRIIQIRFCERLATNKPENALFARALSLSNCQLGDIEAILGNTQAAMWNFEQGREISARLYAIFPENVDFALDLCICYERLGDQQATLGNTLAAMEYFEQCREIRAQLFAASPENPAFASALSVSICKLGDQEVALGNTQMALGYFEKSTEIPGALVANAPEDTSFARNLSVIYDRLGDIQSSLGNAQAALDYLEQSQDIRARLMAIAPENATFARDLGISYNKLGLQLAGLGNSQAALNYFERGYGIARRLFTAAPENTEFAVDLSISYEKLGDMQAALGNTQVALNYFEQSRDIRAKLFAAASGNVLFARDLGIICERLGGVQIQLGNTQAALNYFEQTRAFREQLYAATPGNVVFVRDLNIIYERLGDLQVLLGNTQAALAYFEQSLEIRVGLFATTPENTVFAHELSMSHEKLGDIHAVLGNTQLALDYFKQSREIRARLHAIVPENSEFARSLSLSYNKLGNLKLRLGDAQVAVGYFEKSREISTALCSAFPESAVFARDLGVIYAKLAQNTQGRIQASWWRQCLKQFKAMQEQGTLAESDIPLLDGAQQQVSLEGQESPGADMEQQPIGKTSVIKKALRSLLGKLKLR